MASADVATQEMGLAAVKPRKLALAANSVRIACKAAVSLSPTGLPEVGLGLRERDPRTSSLTSKRKISGITIFGNVVEASPCSSQRAMSSRPAASAAVAAA
eukprot:CAMPEP_0178461266 /NCGR_PEP_ID=MMETSP0689_2-20121128/49209_1 /TAXON_ID=160604 /ORGANISM="Amphidinium massartii, Strain CS-259" /LENGTH=100 /DNA_ID=CAMNT_0020088073 /DNA_START=43 /DNA_END=341 /DNA_ORIENTATION=-